MKPTVYLETTIVSYLVANQSKDLIQAARQQATRDWWTGRSRFDLYASAAVVTEARRGNVTQAARRLEALAGIPLLSTSAETAGLIQVLLCTGTLPTAARMDAVHLATAAINGIDYLLTWNLRHLANAAIRGKIEESCVRAGFVAPVLCTPEELMEI